MLAAAKYSSMKNPNNSIYALTYDNRAEIFHFFIHTQFIQIQRCDERLYVLNRFHRRFKTGFIWSPTACAIIIKCNGKMELRAWKTMYWTRKRSRMRYLAHLNSYLWVNSFNNDLNTFEVSSTSSESYLFIPIWHTCQLNWVIWYTSVWIICICESYMIDWNIDSALHLFFD